MIGVVLWSDHDDRKAVIWCEDQGDLAFLSDTSNDHIERARFYNVGDVVSFELTFEKNMRLAVNPMLVSGFQRADLASRLRDVAERCEMTQKSETSGQILPFPKSASARRRADLQKPVPVRNQNG